MADIEQPAERSHALAECEELVDYFVYGPCDQHLPDEISLEEGGFPPSTLAELQRLGHKLTFFTVPTTGWTIAATIQRTPHGWEGKADPRLRGLAAGY